MLYAWNVSKHWCPLTEVYRNKVHDYKIAREKHYFSWHFILKTAATGVGLIAWIAYSVVAWKVSYLFLLTVCKYILHIHLFPPNLGGSARILDKVHPIRQYGISHSWIKAVRPIRHKSLISAQCKRIRRSSLFRCVFTTACLHYTNALRRKWMRYAD